MSSHESMQQIETAGHAGGARAALSRAVKEAGRVHGVHVAQEVSTPPAPVDFTSLGLEGWKSKGALSLFKLNDGRVFFTDGRDVARRTSRDGPLVVTLLEAAGGTVTPMPVTELLASSVAALPGVLTMGQPLRQGANAPGLRMFGGVKAALLPLAGTPVAQRVALRQTGGVPAEVTLDRALLTLGLRWLSVDGSGEAQLAEGEAQVLEVEAGVMLEETWLAGGTVEAAALLRLSALRTMGVVAGDDAAQDAGAVARFLCAFAEREEDEAQAVQAALAAAVESSTDEGAGDQARQQRQQAERLTAAGHACVAALRAGLDALGTTGAAEVLRGARALRTELGVPASTAARGTLAARALRARAREEPPAASPPPAPRRRSPRPSPSNGGEGRGAALTPRSALIQRIIDARNAENAAAGTPGTSRTLTFEDAAGSGERAASRRRLAERAAEGEPAPARRRLGEVGADAFAGLRPVGEEGADAARVMRELEAQMGGEGAVGSALAKAAGRLAELTPSVSAGSRLAQQAAAADWRELVELAQVGEQLREEEPPLSWEEAAGRLLHVAQEGARARLAPGATRSALARQQEPAPPASAIRSLRDLPPGAVAKLAAVKSESSSAGARAADAIVLQPLTTLEAMAAELTAPAPADDTSAVRRLVSNPAYGEAAWAAIFSNGKYVGTMPSEGAVPATVVAARQRLFRMLQRMVEAVVGEERLETAVVAEIEKLVESVLAVDLELGPVVKLLGGQAPDPAETRAGSFRGEIEGGRWGATSGLTAPADIRDALGRLSELLGVAHVSEVLTAG